MVDTHLPLEDKPRPLRHLFLDFNSFFASVEQQENPELRGKPVVVAPLPSDTTCAIAASYEAKRFGIKTGTNIGEAKVLCPDLIIVSGSHHVYKGYHEALLTVVSKVLPIDEVHSIDEMSFRLLGAERDAEAAVEIAREIKRTVSQYVGECMTSSIGIAPNKFLAKLATEMQKPNGLVVLEAQDLPQKLFSLKLTDFCGINKRMQVRLNAAGMFTVEQLCTASKKELREAFGSVVGEKWWYLIRGFDMDREETNRKSLSHSHVLPPELRTDQGARDVLLRLAQKASARLRSEQIYASTMHVGVSSRVKSWEQHIRMEPTQDTVAINNYLLEAWKTRDFQQPMKVSVVFGDLKRPEEVTPSLFDPAYDRMLLNRAVDRINGQFGKNVIHLAGMEQAKDTGSERIAFNKTWLFREGKGDNDWESVYRRILGFDPEEQEAWLDRSVRRASIDDDLASLGP